MNRAARISEAWGFSPSSRAGHRAPSAEAVSLSASAAFCHFTESVGVVPALGSASAGNASDEIPAFNPVAKTSEDNGRITGGVGPAAGEASRPHGADHAGGTPPPIRRDQAGRAAATSFQPAAHPAVTAPAFNPKPPALAGAVVLSAHAMIIARAIAAYEQVSTDVAVAIALASHATRIGAGPLARAALDEQERTHSTHNLAERVNGGAGGVDACPAGALAGEDLIDLPAFERRPFNRYRSGGP